MRNLLKIKSSTFFDIVVCRVTMSDFWINKLPLLFMFINYTYCNKNFSPFIYLLLSTECILRPNISLQWMPKTFNHKLTSTSTWDFQYFVYWVLRLHCLKSTIEKFVYIVISVSFSKIKCFFFKNQNTIVPVKTKPGKNWKPVSKLNPE